MLLTALSSLSPPKPVSSRSLPVPLHDVMFSPLRSHVLSLTRALRMALRPLQSVKSGPAILQELAHTGQSRRGGKR
ncbi:hypothetical protein BKA82DRAFT_333258 [Pisolithus tinctorius]|nr:hypothetical protein BKA82DRAFT_333258 [Pisolithus tinctorius]